MAEFTGRAKYYIFDGAGGMRDQLEQAVLTELENKQYPLQARIKSVKSGGFLLGTKEQCVVIDIEGEYQVCIANTTVGTYLYVGIYLIIPFASGEGADWAAKVGDVFKLQRINAYYEAAVHAAESAFNNLALKQTRYY